MTDIIGEKEIPIEQEYDAEDEFDEDTTNTFDSDEFEPEVAEDDKKTWKELSRVSKKQAKTLSTMWQKAVNAKQVH